MRILVSGSRGFIGGSLLAELEKQGHEVVRLVRGDPDPGSRDLGWEPLEGRLDASRLEGLDGVVHLAGESVAPERWTREKKERIRASRVEGTRLLAGALASRARKPRVLVSASSVSVYGDRGDEVLTEESPPGRGFLAQVCRDWEAATGAAAEAGIRVVILRFGIVLAPGGGALSAMLPHFRKGLGVRLGSGKQWQSWIALPDLLAAIGFALAEQRLAGPVNAVAPGSVTNREFAETLARLLGKERPGSIPAFAARLAFGEAVDELGLPSHRVRPARLEERGFRFRHPGLEAALQELVA